MGMGIVPALSLLCTDVDFEGATLSVANLGGTKYCCTVCSDDNKKLCCPSKDVEGDVGMPTHQTTKPAHPHV